MNKPVDDALERGEFSQACYHGEIGIIKDMIAQGPQNWQYGLDAACAGGQEEVILLMIEYGANDWNDALYYACAGGYRKSIDLLIARGAADWNEGLQGACGGNQPEIVRLMIEYGANDWNNAFIETCSGNHTQLAKLLLKRGVTTCGLYHAGLYGNVETVELLLEHGAIDLNEGLMGACLGQSFKYGDDDRYQTIIRMMIDKGATRCICRKSIAEH